MRVFLISNSGRPFLEHCRPALGAFLKGTRRLGFVTAAAYDGEAAYFETARDALEPLGLEVVHLRSEDAAQATLATCDAVFVGGGNTYHLLRRLHAAGLVEAIRDGVLQGMPYAGSSAGSNVAGPNILTTNDWNVDGTTRFDALGLVPFNVNPHYLETDPAMAPFSETRAERIGQYLAVHPNPVCGIEEQTCVRGEDGGFSVLGAGRVRVFRRGAPPRIFASGERLDVA